MGFISAAPVSKTPVHAASSAWSHSRACLQSLNLAASSGGGSSLLWPVPAGGVVAVRGLAVVSECLGKELGQGRVQRFLIGPIGKLNPLGVVLGLLVLFEHGSQPRVEGHDLRVRVTKLGQLVAGLGGLVGAA